MNGNKFMGYLTLVENQHDFLGKNVCIYIYIYTYIYIYMCIISHIRSWEKSRTVSNDGKIHHDLLVTVGKSTVIASAIFNSKV